MNQQSVLMMNPDMCIICSHTKHSLITQTLLAVVVRMDPSDGWHGNEKGTQPVAILLLRDIL